MANTLMRGADVPPDSAICCDDAMGGQRRAVRSTDFPGEASCSACEVESYRQYSAGLLWTLRRAYRAMLRGDDEAAFSVIEKAFHDSPCLIGVALRRWEAKHPEQAARLRAGATDLT